MVHHSKRRNSKGGGGLLTTVQHECYDKNTGLAGQRQKVRLGFSLRRVGWAEGGAGGIRAAVVAEGAGTCGAAAAVGPLQHAGLKIWVAPGVLHEVIAAHEALVTKRAPKLLLPRVGAIVAGQLIGASKLLTAVRPGTWERSFSCNTQREGETSVLSHTRR